jgi:hypothetical protein
MANLPEPVDQREAPKVPVAPEVPPSKPRRPDRRRVVAAPPPSAVVTLAIRAAEVQRARAGPTPARWLLPGFAADVERVRRQLGPLHDRRMLVASFERESSRIAALRRLASDPSAPPLPLDPLEAAYAIRWLELSDGPALLPPWATFLDPDTGSAG